MSSSEANQPEAGAVPGAVSRYQSNKYKIYVLIMLTTVYSFNFIDRQLLSILQEAVKHDLGLSDTQLGLLTGFAFAFFYVAAGIPIARWADKGNRRNILALSLGCWSFMTAISGYCQSFVQLLMARIGVGVGEAGGTPAAHSMISDIFEEKNRAKAMSFYSLGINLGIMFGFLFGGILNEYFGWRVAFVVVGVPGLVLALWVRFTIQEPVRGWADAQAAMQKPKADAEKGDSLITVVKDILSKPVLRHMAFGSGLASMASYAMTSWSAPFYIRLFDMNTAELGVWLAAASGIFGALGTFGAGVIVDRFGATRKSYFMYVPALALFVNVPLVAVQLLVPSQDLSLMVNLLTHIFAITWLGPSLALLHGQMKPLNRATASAIYFFILNIIGLGCGPFLAGFVSDMLSESLGVESVRYALLLVVCPASLWAAFHLFLAGRALRNACEN